MRNASNQEHRLSSTARQWAEAEFSEACLGDERLLKRLITVSADLLDNLDTSLPEACGGNWAKTKAAYRFFDNENVTPEKILATHRRATAERMAQHDIVLAVQDTTVLDFTTHPKTAGLGLTGSSKRALGMFLHTTFAVTPEGDALGIIDGHTWIRPPDSLGKANRREELPLAEKESSKWLKSFAATAELATRCPNSRIISIADREGDLYDLFLAAAADARVGVLVRCKQARRLQGQAGLSWATLSAQPLAGTTPVRVPRQPGKAERVATLEVRFAEVTLRPPARKAQAPPVVIWLIEGREINSSEAKPLLWRLATTVRVSNFQESVERLRWYERRWLVEEFHRVLKSGCGAEKRQLQSVERLEKILLLDMIIAWKVLELRRVARQEPNASAAVRLEASEREVLKVLLKKKPGEDLLLGEAVATIAKLGGFLGRKSDGAPGATTIWRGLKRLEQLTAGYLLK